jgi:hypothetical protein
LTDLGKLFKGEHPFICDPGQWIVVGHGLTGKEMKSVPIEGQIQIRHQGEKVISDGTMKVVSHVDQVSFKSYYEMTPTDMTGILSFYQPNEEVGDLRGQVIAFDDRIISSYVSGDGSLAGTEIFQRISDRRYSVTGSLTKEGEVVNLWKMEMVRLVEDKQPQNSPEEKEESA